ncbi:MAG: hypothetical protein A4E30_00185 [Methanomassiliicoccales archaeon PtaB.Bin215]|nr:MAG: hypothetical protein A4E30_00185 [Methanomassiliicoccales archaeon PtaB.Bin215]
MRPMNPMAKAMGVPMNMIARSRRAPRMPAFRTVISTPTVFRISGRKMMPPAMTTSKSRASMGLAETLHSSAWSVSIFATMASAIITDPNTIIA